MAGSFLAHESPNSMRGALADGRPAAGHVKEFLPAWVSFLPDMPGHLPVYLAGIASRPPDPGAGGELLDVAVSLLTVGGPFP
jgi:hypothetical protein